MLRHDTPRRIAGKPLFDAPREIVGRRRHTYGSPRQRSDADRELDRASYLAAQASYGSKAHEEKLLRLGYGLDTELSGDKYRVYSHPERAIVAYRGTQLNDLQDLSDDLGIATANYNTSGFKSGREIADAARKKYNSPIHHAGHSLGGTKALTNARYYGETATAFNPGSSPIGLNAGDNSVYISRGDVITGRLRGSNITEVPGSTHTISQYESMFEE